NQSPPINRAEAIQKMLVEDLEVDAAHVRHFKSDPNSMGNVRTIRRILADEGLDPKKCALISNFYHLPRVAVDLESAYLPIPIYPAEAFWIMERKLTLIERFGGNQFAKRIGAEIQGIADKIQGTYKSGA